MAGSAGKNDPHPDHLMGKRGRKRHVSELVSEGKKSDDDFYVIINKYIGDSRVHCWAYVNGKTSAEVIPLRGKMKVLRMKGQKIRLSGGEFALVSGGMLHEVYTPEDAVKFVPREERTALLRCHEVAKGGKADEADEAFEFSRGAVADSDDGGSSSGDEEGGGGGGGDGSGDDLERPLPVAPPRKAKLVAGGGGGDDGSTAPKAAPAPAAAAGPRALDGPASVDIDAI